MNILITGGTGYIGYSLVHQLLENNVEINKIVIFDNLSNKKYDFFTAGELPTEKIKFVQGDLLDGRKLEKYLKDIHWVYHLAAKVTTPFADREAHFYDQINHWGTAQLVQSIERSDVKGVVYLSSASVYGDGAENADESYTPHPNSFYGISKYDGEQQVKRMGKRLKTFIIRSANIYGFNPAFRIDAVVNRFMFEAHFNRKISIHGSGEQMRSFIHIDKAAQTLARLVQDTVPTGTYNLGEHNLSVMDIAEAIKEVYPDLEMININHQMKMKNQSLAIPCRITELIPWTAKSLSEELSAFRASFSF